MRWFSMKGPEGTITCKGNFAAQAIREAAERWGCDPAEIVITGEAAYNQEKAAAEGQLRDGRVL